MSETVIKIEHVSKEYRLGAIGGTTLQDDLQRLGAKLRGREDPTLRVGQETSVRNERFLALDDISFEIERGEAVGIIGHNGAGKSTLLKLLSRVTAPTTGTISFNGRIASMLEVGTGFHPELTGRENIYMNGAILGMTRAEIDRKIDEIIAFAEIEQFIDTPVKRYSSGMYVKLGFSVAAHLDSEIMIMDEVLAVGDMRFQQKCLDRMSDASNREGRTILYVSHNVNTIRQLCTRCIVLDHGRVVFDGDTGKAIEQYLGEERTFGASRDFRHYIRPAWLQRDELRLCRAGFRGKDSASFKFGEELCIEFEVHYTGPLDRIGLRFEVLNHMQQPVGTSVTFDLPLSVSEQQQTFCVRYHLTNLMPGEYGSFFTFFTYNDFGTNFDIDCTPGLRFTIEDQDDSMKLDWKTSRWGCVMFPEGHVEQGGVHRDA